MDTIENKLKDLILSKYKSLREFTLKIEMPYSTLDTILKRGVDKANIVNILKICYELNISADKLANGLIEYNLKKTDNNLSKEEIMLLENYNRLNDLGKNRLIEYSTDLTETPKYIENSQNEINTNTCDEFTIAKNKALEARINAEQCFRENPDLIPKASHDKHGSFTDEEYKHDDDIMNDDDFWNK